jgi:hypothetical protein
MSNYKLKLDAEHRNAEISTATKKLVQDLSNEQCSIDRANKMLNHSIDYTNQFGMNKANQALQNGIKLFLNK